MKWLTACRRHFKTFFSMKFVVSWSKFGTCYSHETSSGQHPWRPTDDKPAWVQMMDWRQTGDKPYLFPVGYWLLKHISCTESDCSVSASAVTHLCNANARFNTKKCHRFGKYDFCMLSTFCLKLVHQFNRFHEPFPIKWPLCGRIFFKDSLFFVRKMIIQTHST